VSLVFLVSFISRWSGPTTNKLNTGKDIDSKFAYPCVSVRYIDSNIAIDDQLAGALKFSTKTHLDVT
jgi:hypothetical protein